jgi:hypothetical protein
MRSADVSGCVAMVPKKEPFGKQAQLGSRTAKAFKLGRFSQVSKQVQGVIPSCT